MDKLKCQHCGKDGLLPEIFYANACLIIRLSKKFNNKVICEYISGYRCVVHDKTINPNGKNRTHTLGIAIDSKYYYFLSNKKIYINRKEVMNEAKTMGIFGGIGIMMTVIYTLILLKDMRKTLCYCGK